MILRRFFILTIALAILSPLAAHAQLDQRCFTKKACEAVRKDLTGNLRPNDGIGDGFVKNSETISACGETDANNEELGFCLPAGSTKTATSFGGRDTFSDMADFIQYGYRFAIIVAGLLAVLITIVSGFQWMASGGNSDTIHTAQERIKNAVIGLSLAVLSYTILNQVNPYLVHLRLPQVWLVNKQGTVPGYCNSVQNGVQLAFNKITDGSTQSDQEKIASLQNANENKLFTYSNATAECGKEYFTANGGLQTCRGSACPSSPGGAKQVCLPSLENETSECRAGNIGGVIYNSSVTATLTGGSAIGSALSESWAWPTWVEGIQLYRVCNDGDTNADLNPVSRGSMLDRKEANKTQRYTIPVPNQAITSATNDCKSHGGLKGFVVYADMNESTTPDNEPHMLGMQGQAAVDLGDKNSLIRNGGAFNQTRITAPKTYFLQPEDLQRGLQFNIDVAQITDIDAINPLSGSSGDDQRREVYGKFGFK